MTAKNLTGPLKISAAPSIETLADVLRGAKSLMKLRKWNKLLPELEYPTIKLNRSVTEAAGGLLVISQFTLIASTAKGNRPSFIAAARPEEAVPLYERFLAAVESLVGCRPERGVFAADMKVALVNDGPVTIVIDSRRRE
jgi:D-tyrosyl-tRNA(Tyr) deacylase